METRELELVKKYNLPHPLLTLSDIKWRVFKDSECNIILSCEDLIQLNNLDDKHDRSIVLNFYENGRFKKGDILVFDNDIGKVEVIVTVDDTDYWAVKDLLVTIYSTYKEWSLIRKYDIPLPSAIDFSVTHWLLIDDRYTDPKVTVYSDSLYINDIKYKVDLKTFCETKGLQYITSVCGKYTIACIVSRKKYFKRLLRIFKNYYGVVLRECAM